jgi:hypothetical protein
LFLPKKKQINLVQTTLDKIDLEIINEAFRLKDWIRLSEEISVQADSLLSQGKLEVDTVKGILCFTVIISNDFPLGKIYIYCTNVEGYLHQMPSGLLCLNSPPAKKICDRIELEIERLEEWIDKYFIKEIEDEQFEYYLFKGQNDIPVIFEESTDKPQLKGSYGQFKCSVLNERSLQDKSTKTILALDLGGRKCKWSNSFLKTITKQHIGLWVFIDAPPIHGKRVRIEYWKDLLVVLSNKQTEYIYNQAKTLKGQSIYPGGFLLMLGYKIPSPTGSEITWDTIGILFKDFPYSAEKVKNGEYKAKDKGNKIPWCNSYNASYNRMFGRGKLCPDLTDKKILILGTGAIGSSLLLSLVRGGCKQVDINDGDVLEPGNVCRGEFAFSDSFNQKTSSLLTEALKISPHVEIQAGSKVAPITKDNKIYPTIKSNLMTYDYIFDCSTDKYLSIMLDEMELRGTIVNFSISNEANHLVLVSGNGNVHTIKNMIYSKLPDDNEPFYVATGCWHPTFKASFSDISVLLHYAINELNRRISLDKMIRSFVISKGVDEFDNLKYSLSYNV